MSFATAFREVGISIDFIAGGCKWHCMQGAFTTVAGMVTAQCTGAFIPGLL